MSGHQDNRSNVQEQKCALPTSARRYLGLPAGGPAQHPNHPEDCHTLQTLLARSNSVTTRVRTQAAHRAWGPTLHTVMQRSQNACSLSRRASPAPEWKAVNCHRHSRDARILGTAGPASPLVPPLPLSSLSRGRLSPSTPAPKSGHSDSLTNKQLWRQGSQPPVHPLWPFWWKPSTDSLRATAPEQGQGPQGTLGSTTSTQHRHHHPPECRLGLCTGSTRYETTENQQG